jgi:hypothetical protein
MRVTQMRLLNLVSDKSRRLLFLLSSGAVALMTMIFATPALSAISCESLFLTETKQTDQSEFLRARVSIMPGMSASRYVTAELKVSEPGARRLTIRDNVTNRLLDEIDLDSNVAKYGPISRMQIDVYRNLSLSRPDDAAVHSERRGRFLNRYYVNYRPVIYLIEANRVHILEYTAGTGLLRRRTIEAPGIVYVEPVSAKLKDHSGILRYIVHDTVRIYFGNGLTPPIVYDPVLNGRIDPADVIEFTSRDPMANL